MQERHSGFIASKGERAISMKKLWTFLGVTVFAALVGCGKDDAQIQEKAISAPVENLAVHESTSVVQSTSDDRQKSGVDEWGI